MCIGVSLHHYLEATDPASNPPECVRRYAEFLRDKYREMSVLPDPDWPPAMATKDHYTNLAIIERERDSYTGDDEVKARDYVHGRIDKILGEKKPINLEEAFYPIINHKKESRLTILMDGAPGVGKTTITRKLCIDWANGETLQEYQLVLLVPLRELKVSQQEIVSEANLLFGNETVLRKEVWQYMQKYSGSNVLFIFDGFDELSSKQRELMGDSLLVKLIKGEDLFHSSIIVTSRPYASKSLRDFRRVNRHIEVLGFTENQIADCVSQNLYKKDEEKLLQSLKDRQDIRSLCYIPLNCRIVLFVYKHNSCELPETLTQLYEIFILHTIKHYAERISSDSFILKEIDDIDCYDALPVSVKNQLHSLSKMAFSGIQEDKLVFTRHELPKQDLLTLGLLTSLFIRSNISQLKHFQFLHLTLQEFLAAKYLASGSLSTNKVRELFQEKIGDDRFRMTFLFLAGLTKFSFLAPTESLLDESCDFLRSDSKARVLFLSQLLYESKNKVSRISPLLESRLDLSGYQLSQFDLYVLMYVFSCTTRKFRWEEVDLRNCGITDNDFEAILSKKHQKYHDFCVLGMTKVLYLSSKRDTLNLFSMVNYLKQKSLTREVYFSRLQSRSESCTLITSLCQALAKHSKLKKLSFGEQQILSKKSLILSKSQVFILCSKGFECLAKFIDIGNLMTLNLAGHSDAFKNCSKCNGSGEIAIRALVEVIKGSQALHTLNLNDCQLPKNTMEAVFGILVTKGTLTSISLQGNSTTLSSSYLHKAVSDMLRNNPFFQFCGVSLKVTEQSELKMSISSGCNTSWMFNQLCEAVVEGQKFFLHTLTVKNLRKNLVRPICQIVIRTKTLHTFRAYLSNGMTNNELIVILRAFQGNTTVIKLSLWSKKYYRDRTVGEALSAMIEQNKTICTLKLSGLLIDLKCEMLARALLKNTVMKKMVITNHAVASAVKAWIKQLKGEDYTDVSKKKN